MVFTQYLVDLIWSLTMQMLTTLFLECHFSWKYNYTKKLDGRLLNFQGSIRSLSTKFGQSSKLHDPIATITSSSYEPISEDRSSIISLSDKYRQQEEVEIFQEQFFAPPPDPIRPGQVPGRRFGGSSRPSSSYQSSSETFRENFKL